MVEALTESDIAFLDLLREGHSQREAAARLNYGGDWAKKHSRQIRDRLGVSTIEEALQMTAGDGPSKADFDGLKSMIEATNEAVAALAAAVTPQQQQDARASVQAAELDEKAMAKKLGISLEDVARVREENEYAKFAKMQERLEKEREEEALANEPQRDGLGGILNIARGNREAS